MGKSGAHKAIQCRQSHHYREVPAPEKSQLRAQITLIKKGLQGHGIHLIYGLGTQRRLKGIPSDGNTPWGVDGG